MLDFHWMHPFWNGNCIQFADVVHPQPQLVHTHGLTHTYIYTETQMPIRTHLQMHQFIHTTNGLTLNWHCVLNIVSLENVCVFSTLACVVHTYYTTHIFYCCIFSPSLNSFHLSHSLSQTFLRYTHRQQHKCSA